MKKQLFFKSCIIASVALVAAACSEDVELGNVGSDTIETPEGSVIYVTDHEGSRSYSNVELRDNATYSLSVNTAKALASDCNVTFAYDLSVLDSYNKANGTAIEALPQGMVTLANGGTLTLAAGATTASLDYTITSDGTTDHNATYAIPLRLTATGAQLGALDQTRIIFVHDLTSLPNCFKSWTDADGNVHEGVKIFSCMEVNDTNPLNNLRYTLKNSGKYMVDALIMFSANINYNAETGKVFLHCNDNVQAILDNRDKYLKPLKDRGMKVILGVMCNHDRACISNLADETARLFAQELKAACDAYDLDGIFWDDEYCSPIYPAPPGFVNPSNAAFSRLAYEVWKLQPDRWNVAYGYSQTGSAQEVDGVKPGTFIEYVLPDYGYSTSDWSSNYPGMPRNHMGACSMEFAQGRFKGYDQLRKLRDGGWGACMVFAMDPFRGTASGQDNAMNECAKAFYDDEVVVSDVKYSKDWK